MMQALLYRVNPVGWATCKWLRYFWPGCLLSQLNGLSLRRIAEPELPGDNWVRVRTLLGGICGSEAALIGQKHMPNSILQAFTSMPCVLGHENVAVVDHVGPAVDKAWLGRRVCVEPTLCCEVRGIDPPCPRCAEGQFGVCENFAADGLGAAKLPPGTGVGYNSRVGGSFGEFFVAHQSQLVPVPEGISDEHAVLTDPVACSLHAVLRADQLSSAKSVLIYGTGVLGLGLIASMRATGYRGRIDAIGRRQMIADVAADLGGDNFLDLPDRTRDRFERIAELTGATVQRARFGNYMLSGGYDVIFDCLTTRRSITECLKWARARGQVVYLGTGYGGGIDLTSIWFRELHLIGAYGRQMEDYQGRKIGTYQLVHELMASGEVNVEAMLTHKFPLKRFRRALDVALNKGRHNAIKVAFDFR
ncbi:MAG: alcohol dehydrogenase catalytic domain-containing protein [Phycisphaerae bacterium]|nr:alcohol dehydrogenase catalytic domain-containing protein [Phycisphaerae bacterium]